jgi:hypothetical protein
MESPPETSPETSIALPDDAALRAIAEGVEAETGDRFFSSLTRNLALAPCILTAAAGVPSRDPVCFWPSHVRVPSNQSKENRRCASFEKGED